MNDKPTDKKAAAETAGSPNASAVQWRCEVTEAGAGRVYGSSRHRKGRGALVTLGDTEATEAEAKGWVVKAGKAEG
jgi:hypothetical protein